MRGDTNWAWRGSVVLKQAESEVRGQGKEGAKIVVCVVRETTRAKEELGL